MPFLTPSIAWASSVAQLVKNLPAMQKTRVDSWVRRISWRRKWQAAPVFLPGESHGQKSLVDYIQSMGSQRVRRDLATKPPPRPPPLAVALRDYRLLKQLVTSVFSIVLPIYFVSSTLRFMKEVRSV